MKVCVLGSGGWGTALAINILKNGHDVTLWSYQQSEYETLLKNRENPLLKGVKLPEELNLTYDIAAVRGCDAVLLATPSFAVRSTSRAIKDLINPGTPIICVAKGIEKGTSLRMSEIITEETQGKCPVVALLGPTHAEEVSRGVPSAIVASSDDAAAAELTQTLVMNENFRVYTGSDVIGAEIGAALKNVIALCSGVCAGLGYGDNTRAMLMTRGLAEIARLGIALGGRRETFAGLTGVGDLIVTCTSMHSRNNRCGMLIGKGVPPKEAVKLIGGVVEGMYAIESALELAGKHGVEMPITSAAHAVAYDGAPLDKVIQQLMTRSRRDEAEDTWSLV